MLNMYFNVFQKSLKYPKSKQIPNRNRSQNSEKNSEKQKKHQVESEFVARPRPEAAKRGGSLQLIPPGVGAQDVRDPVLGKQILKHLEPINPPWFSIEACV